MYRSDIDLLKGIAIIAVIFYHIGILPFGFLGVDTFLAVNGFLIIPPLVRKIHENQFNYFEFLTRRISRLWPIVVAASAVCLLLGCWLMLPGAYEDLSESVIASNFFLQNILSSITTDYWDSATEYKPLMQMWYLGVIVQFYLIIPLIFMAFNKCFSKFFKGIVFWNYIILLLFLSSLAIYLFYPDSFNHKFYFVQYRIWEFMLGGFLGLNIGNFKIKYNLIQYGGIVLLCLIFGFGFKTLSDIDEVTIIGAGTEPAGELLKMILTVITVCITAMIMLKNVKWGGAFVISERCH